MLIKLGPEYNPEYLQKRAGLKTSHLPDGFDPVTYPSELQVSDYHAEHGIRAWVGIKDPKTTNKVFLPIYRADYFESEEQVKIPSSSDDTLPGEYVDHSGMVFKVAVAWMELDETPALIGEAGNGKGHPVDTKVLTPQGWCRVGDIKPGDFVIGSNGKSTKVTNIFPRGKLPVSRVTMTDGSSVLVDNDHLWRVKPEKPTAKWRTMPTRDLASESLTFSHGYRWKIPMVQPVEFDSNEALPIDPYLLGVLIANGALTSGEAVISTNDLQVINRCILRGANISERTPTPARRWKAEGNIWNKLRILGLAGLKSAEKFIPEIYLRSSIEDRRSLLAALLDCDGCTNGRHTMYDTMSEQLANDVIELVQSLGGTASSRVSDRDGCITVAIALDKNPFLTSRKVALWDSVKHRQPLRKIKSITQEGEAEVVCIQVEAEDHLYVTEDYIVTHNTELLRHIAWIMQLPFERITITASSEVDDLAGKFVFEDGETAFKYGRLARAWGKPNVLCLDEPNTGPNDVLQFIRPLIDNSKQLVLDQNKGEQIFRNDGCYLGMAMNPSFDYRNIGANPMADADNSRLLHLEVPLPPETVEREIVKSRLMVKDGWEIPDKLLDSVVAIARTLREMSHNNEVPFSWGIRVQIKVARLLHWFDFHDAYLMAMGSSVDEETRDKVISVVKANTPSRK
jgi:MoxR-like ATPase